MGIQIGNKPKFKTEDLAKYKISEDALKGLNEKTLSMDDDAFTIEPEMKNAYEDMIAAFKRIETICKSAKDNKNLKTKKTKTDINEAIKKAGNRAKYCDKRKDELTENWKHSKEVWYALGND